MKDLLSTWVNQDIVFINNIRELKNIKGLSSKRLCIIKTDFKDLVRIKKVSKYYPGVKFWLAAKNISRQNIVKSKEFGFENVIEYPLKQEIIDDLIKEKPDKAAEEARIEKENARFLAVKGLKVMIVDDNHLNTELLAETLKALNLNLSVYQKPKEAAKVVDREKFDLFLLDIMMPELSGYDLAAIIKKSKLNYNTPIIFVSAFSDTENKVKSYNLGSYGFIEKPYNIKVVKSQICSLLKAHNDREREARQQDSYLAMVTHDMKGPVQAELSAIQLLLDMYGNDLEDDKKEVLVNLLHSTKYLQNLVVNVLQKYICNSGNGVIINKKLNSFKKLVSECCDETKYMASDRNLKIKVSYKTCIENIYFDYDELKRVINNILTNAVKYSSRDNDIIVNIMSDSENIIFSVKNFGIGINLPNPNDVFEKFTTFCESQKSVNSGLGLYISKQIIDAHGGTINFHSIPDKETTVTFTIPINIEA